jgi:hypothetical protein
MSAFCAWLAQSIRIRRFRGANVGRSQATSGDNQPWFVQLDAPSGHTQPHAATGRMRLKRKVGGSTPPLTTVLTCADVRVVIVKVQLMGFVSHF